MNKTSIDLDINVNREQLDDTINKLEKIKDLMKEIREIDNNFSLSNVIEADKDTILVFKYNNILFKQEDLNRHEEILSDKLRHKCILLNGNVTLDKAIGIDYAKGRDYTTVIYYNEKGNPIKEETTQYK